MYSGCEFDEDKGGAKKLYVYPVDHRELPGVKIYKECTTFGDNLFFR